MKGLVCERCEGELRAVQTHNVRGKVRLSTWRCRQCGHRESKILAPLKGLSAYQMAQKLETRDNLDVRIDAQNI